MNIPEHLNLPEQLAAKALKIGAIKLSVSDPFTWASGYRMPIYNDNRLLFSAVENRKLITEGFLSLSKDLPYQPEIICGCATGGIAPAVTLADKLELAFQYVRSGGKAHGLGNRIEGADASGKRVLIIEDLISSGGSSLSVVDAVKNSGGKVEDVFSIFTYGFGKADEAANSAGVRFTSLFDFNILLEVAAQSGYIAKEDLQLLNQWQKAPFEWQENLSD